MLVLLFVGGLVVGMALTCVFIVVVLLLVWGLGHILCGVSNMCGRACIIASICRSRIRMPDNISNTSRIPACISLQLVSSLLVAVIS